MTKQHKTLETLIERAERRGTAGNGKWEVEVIRNGSTVKQDGSEDIIKIYVVRHYGTEVLKIAQYVNNKNGYDKPITTPTMGYHYGQSKSDADGLNAVCAYFGMPHRFTYKPVNGGFQMVEEEA